MYRLTLIAGVLVFVSACGGGSSGGSSSSTTASTLAFPVATAISNLDSNGFTSPFTVSGKLNGTSVIGSGSITASSDQAATFEGQQALVSTLTISATLKSSQGSAPFATTGQGYSDTDYRPLGVDTGTEYWVMQGTANVPGSVKVGDTAVVGTYNRYSDSTKSTLLGTARESYLIEQDTSTTAILNAITNEYDTSNAQISSAQVRYRIDNNGAINWLSEAISYLSGSTTGTLTFTK